jgi:hypothetical protein
MQRAAQNEWNRHGIGVHHQYVLQAERGHAWCGQYFVDRMDGSGHIYNPYGPGDLG